MKLRYKIAGGVLIFLGVAISLLALVLSHSSACGPAPAVAAEAELMKASDLGVFVFASIGKPTTRLCLLIGPEGGFSEREYEDAGIAGFQAVSLGPRILRTETAALAAITIAQSCWGDL